MHEFVHQVARAAADDEETALPGGYAALLGHTERT